MPSGEAQPVWYICGTRQCLSVAPAQTKINEFVL